MASNSKRPQRTQQRPGTLKQRSRTTPATILTMPSAIHGQQPSQGRFATADSSSPPWTEHNLHADGPVESTLTKRRREANRLAAQRFRSRKKGYQDSLEERVRVLENEKAQLQDELRAQPSSSASPKDIKPVNAFDAAAQEAVKELRRENSRLRAELEESRGDAKHWQEEARSLSASFHGSQSSASSVTHDIKRYPHVVTYKRRRTSEDSYIIASPHDMSPPVQLPTPQEYPFAQSRSTLPLLDLTQTQGVRPPLPSPSVFLSSHSNSAESFKLAPLRLPPSPPKASIPVPPPAPSPRTGFEILLAVGQEIDGKGSRAGEQHVYGTRQRA